ncbi:MAG: lysophospholipid acyltransferase family protein [Pseudomonadota bacterium]
MARVRAILFIAFVAMVTVIFGALIALSLPFGGDGARNGAKAWNRTAFWGLRLIGGVTFRVENPERLPEGGALIAANHQSMWETMALYILLPRPAMIARKSLTKIPIFGWLLGPGGAILVDREGGAKAMRGLLREAQARVEKGEQVIVFPEGTRVPTGQTRPFKPGVAGICAAIKAPCTPIAHNSGAFWPHRALALYPGQITLRVLPAIEPGKDRNAFLRTLEAAIINARPDLNPDQETKVPSSMQRTSDGG